MSETLRQVLNVIAPICIVAFFPSAGLAFYMSSKDIKPGTASYNVAAGAWVATGVLLVSGVAFFLIGSVYI